MKSDLLISYYSATVCNGHPSHECWCLSLNMAAPFTFSAKEKDQETGFSYFGSRYYSSDLSIWLSVDPMSDKYPSLSPYTYCADNPVKLVDPNGEEIWIIGSDENTRLKYTVGMQYDGSDEKIKARVENLNSIYGTDVGKGVVTSLAESEQSYVIMDNDNQCSSNSNWIENDSRKGGCGGQIMLNNDNLSVLSHEIFHAYQSEKGKGGAGCILNEVEAYLFQYMVTDNCGLESLFSNSGLEGDQVRSYNYAVQAIWDTRGTDSACMEEVINGFKDFSHANRNGNYTSKNLYNRKRNHTSLFSN